MREETEYACIPAPGEAVERRRRSLPDLEPGAVLLRTLYSEVCGTDCHLFHGRLAGVPYPLTPGHVNVGRIEAMGGEVRDVEGRPFAEGEVVTFLDVHETCGTCWYCLVAKAATRCPHRKVYGITYGSEEGLLGGWSQHIYLKPGVKIVRLPMDVSPRAFIAGGCGMVTGFHAVERGAIALGDTVVVQGAGPVGLSAVVWARRSGAAKIVLVGAPAARLELGKQFGADEVIDVGETEADERIRKVLAQTGGGRGADVVIEASGSPGAVVEGMRMARDAGRYVIAGQYTDHGDVSVNPHADINRKHLEIRGCWGAEFHHLYRGLEMMARMGDEVAWEAMVTRDYGLAEAGEALRDVEARRVIKAIIDPWLEARKNASLLEARSSEERFAARS